MTVATFHNHSHWGAFTAEVEDGRVTGVRPFARDPDPSAMIEAIPEALYAANRIAQPMVREGWLRDGPAAGGAGRGAEPFVPVGWDLALDLVAGELARVKENHGNQAIFGGSQGWSSAGCFHHARTQLRRFLFAFGGCVDQVTNYSFGAAMAFLPHIVGSIGPVIGPLTSWPVIARNTKLMVMFGGANLKNGQVAPGGQGVHSYAGNMREAAAAGVRFVNISPMRDDGPEFLDPQWIPIRPNTDTAMMLALAHTLVAEGLEDAEFVARYCTGFERVKPYLMGESDGRPKDADWAEAITGVDAATIRDLARRMATTRTMLTAAWSLQRADHGEQTYWALILLAALLGQIGLPGGGFGFGYGSLGGLGDPPNAIPVPAMPIGRNPLDLAIPAARITDLLLDPGGVMDFNGATIDLPHIRLIYWAGGNPFHHHQDLNRLIGAWQRPETVIVHEAWWTATARHADIVLPATTTLERNDIGAGSRNGFVFAMQKAVEPVGGARNDFDILADLAARLGFRDAYTEGRDEQAWIRHIYDRCRDRAGSNRVAMPAFEQFWDEGHFELPPQEEDFYLFRDFRADPGSHPLATPSGRIELYSERIAALDYDDCPPHPSWIEPAEWLGADKAKEFPLHLVSSQPGSRLHSQMDGAHVSRATKVAGREPVRIHPDDAAARGIGDGDVVRVFNDRGACLAGAVVSAEVSPGVVRLSNGAWYDPAEPGTPGALEIHGNANTLTLDKGTSKLGQGPSALTALVEIERFGETPPPVKAFSPPATVNS